MIRFLTVVNMLSVVTLGDLLRKQIVLFSGLDLQLVKQFEEFCIFSFHSEKDRDLSDNPSKMIAAHFPTANSFQLTRTLAANHHPYSVMTVAGQKSKGDPCARVTQLTSTAQE